jgi:cytochrome c556
MADLKVDYDQLNASRQALHSLREEFDHATDLADRTEGIWGNGHVSDAIHDFASNWKLHKEKLVAKMQKVEDATEGCLDTFQKADTKIAAGVQVHNAGSRGSAR